MKKSFPRLDFRLIIPVVFLVLISLTILYSINPAYLQNQLFALSIAVIAFFLFSQISYTDFRNLKIPLYVASITLLGIVFLLGFESRGAIRWVEVFGVSLQASEIAKPMISLSFAGLLASYSNKNLKVYILSFLSLIPIFVLIYLQPDLGNALLFVMVAIFSLLIYGMPLSWVVLGAIPFIISSPFVWEKLHDYQRLRVLTFVNPLMDPSGSSYNLIQAIIAVGSGGALGKGISEGTQSRLKFLPENHTDFIFASLAEKLGFLGSLLVVVLFIFLFVRIYQIFIKTKDVFGQIFVSSAFFFILIQFFVNVGMNLGLVPIVGITLPFVSYGGSSLLANFILLGILSSVSVRNNRAEILQIK